MTVTIFKPEVERKQDRRALLRKERNTLLNQRYKINQRLEQIKKELDMPVDHLEVSNHAIQRFQERIENVPTKVARKILSESTLIEKYKRSGKGKFKLTAYPSVIVVISNFTVVTCFHIKDYRLRLEELEHYMDYYIDQLVASKLCGCTPKVNTLREFRKQYYN
jgi:hypothetical protein